MPSVQHQSLAGLFRDQPALGLRLFESVTGKTLPAGVRAQLYAAQFSELHPPEYAADAVYLLVDTAGDTTGALIIEIQLRRDDEKPPSWLLYTAALNRKLNRPVTVLAIALNESVASWCAEPYIYDHLGSGYRPIVIGPSGVPRITDIDQAKAMPELAVLSVAAHGQEEDAEAIGIPAFLACATLDKRHAAQYADVVLAWLNDNARRALMEFLSMHDYQFQSEFAKSYAEEGRKEGIKEGLKEGLQKLLLKQLTLKFGDLPEDVVQRVRQAGDEQLERWGERVLTAATLDDVFDVS